MENPSTTQNGNTPSFPSCVSGPVSTDTARDMELMKRLLHSSDSKVAAAAMRIFAPKITSNLANNKAENSNSSLETVNTSTDATGTIPVTPQIIQNSTPNPTNVTVQSQQQPVVHPSPAPTAVPSSSAVATVTTTVENVGGQTKEEAASPGYQPLSVIVSSKKKGDVIGNDMALVKTKELIDTLCKPEECNEGSSVDPPTKKKDDDTPSHSNPNRSGGKKQTSGERLARSRERNRMHARKTRQRKKEHMQSLQNRANDLKEEQLNLKQAINEKSTANILLGMVSTKTSSKDADKLDAKVEQLLKRPVEDIPDSSKISELPALILPGQHTKKSKRTLSNREPQEHGTPATLHPDDGIDYELLSKDRSQCTPAELNQIRRERNRMHAKRTRDRKRIFMEEMERVIKTLQIENMILKTHLEGLGQTPTTKAEEAAGKIADEGSLSNCSTPALSSPLLPSPLPETSTQAEVIQPQVQLTNVPMLVTTPAPAPVVQNDENLSMQTNLNTTSPPAAAAAPAAVVASSTSNDKKVCITSDENQANFMDVLSSAAMSVSGGTALECEGKRNSSEADDEHGVHKIKRPRLEDEPPPQSDPPRLSQTPMSTGSAEAIKC